MQKVKSTTRSLIARITKRSNQGPETPLGNPSTSPASQAHASNPNPNRPNASEPAVTGAQEAYVYSSTSPISTLRNDDTTVQSADSSGYHPASGRLLSSSASASAVTDPAEYGLKGPSEIKRGQNVEHASTETHKEKPTRIDLAASELTTVLAEFKCHYEDFASNNQQFVLLADEFNQVFQDADAQCDIKQAAQTLGTGIQNALQIIEKKQKLSGSKWTTKAGSFLTRLYPVARLSLGLAAAIGEGFSFAPLKGAAGGLIIILQILENESGRRDDFLYYLGKIEFLAAILVDNPKYDLDSESTRDLLGEKSTQLMTAMVRFFNSALIYFSRNYLGNLSKTILNGSDIYEEGKKRLDAAVQDYNQTILCLTARIVAGLKYQQQNKEVQRQDEEFLKWLSPSYWLVEGQLYSLREHRAKNTLQWALAMEEFQKWQLAELDELSKDRILWIRGPLGIGKSTMASYFIDLLKCQFPNSIVAFFFCRSNQAGLTKARDIIRTLAYQCIENNTAARSMLEDLKRKDFNLSGGHGVCYLFEKLLLEPLHSCRKDVYIIIDGLDEADLVRQDSFDPLNRSEMEILLANLTRLPFTRLLFISRPNANVSYIIPNMNSKPIRKDENQDDIDNYVKNTTMGSKNLQKNFTNENVDPLTYFREHANGIFLWVVLVLQQLSKAKSKSVFLKCLNHASEASGSMEKLYTSILNKFEEEDRKWIQEILRWLTVARRQLTVQELKSAVEWCLKDELTDFQSFLEVECGSILHLIPGFKEGLYVQLVHETLGSFLLNGDDCPTDFLVDEATANGHLASVCLQHLSVVAATELRPYALAEWLNHFTKGTATKQPAQLFFSLHSFFTSNGVKVWLKSMLKDLRPYPRRGLYVSSEPLRLYDFSDWLGKNLSYGVDSQPPDEIEGQLAGFIDCQPADLGDSSILGQIVGKAAVDIWLYEKGLNFKTVQTSFLLALKYYYQRKNRSLNNLEELAKLTATEFNDIIEWADGHRSRSIEKSRLGPAYFITQKWNHCIKCFTNGPDADPGFNDFNRCEIYKYLGIAYQAIGDYGTALINYRKGIESSWDENSIFDCNIVENIVKLYVARGDYDGAINYFEMISNRFSAYTGCYAQPFEAYAIKEDYERAKIDLVKAAKNNSLYFEEVLHAYLAMDDYDGGIKFFQEAAQQNSNDYIIHECLSRILLAKGDYDGAIRSIGACEYNEIWRDTQLSFLIELYIQKGEHQIAIRVFETAIRNTECEYYSLMSAVFEAYRAVGDYDRAIDAFETLCYKAQNCSKFERNRRWGFLVYTYVAKGDHNSAVRTFETARNVLKANVESDLMKSGIEAYIEMGCCEKAINAFQAFVAQKQEYSAEYLWTSCLAAFEAQGNIDGAVEMFKILLGSDPTESWPWFGLGHGYTARFDYDIAIDIYQSAVEKFPNDYSFLKLLGDVYCVQHKYSEAINAWEAATQKACSKTFVFAYLGLVPSRSNYIERPEINQSFLQHFLWYSLGEAHRAKNDYNSATKLYDSAVAEYKHVLKRKWNNLWWFRHDPSICQGEVDVFRQSQLPDVVIWSALGAVYRAKGDMVEAISAFRKALDSKPKNLWIRNQIHDLESQIK